MRKLRWGLLLVVLASVGMVLPAHAGGPTSVMVSAPGIPKVVATGYQDPRYDELTRAVGMEAKDHPGWTENGHGPVIRATWLIHDTSVWRLDLIYPDAEGGPWVATFVDRTGTGKLADKPVWHPAADGPAVTKVLGELGLLSPQQQGDGATPDALTSEEVTAPVAADIAAGESSTFTGWRWAIPGVALGAVVALLAVRLVPRRRWELIDQD